MTTWTRFRHNSRTESDIWIEAPMPDAARIFREKLRRDPYQASRCCGRVWQITEGFEQAGPGRIVL